MLHKQKLEVPSQQRDMLQNFQGLNRNLRAADGEFFDMKNMTGDQYPVLSTRKKRGIVKTLTAPGGMITKDALCYVDNGSLYVNDLAIAGLTLSAGQKQLIGMGAYILIWPDKKWYNTADGTYGNMEHTAAAQDVGYSLCRLDGTAYENYLISDTAPEDPHEGSLWLDTSAEPPSLKQYTMDPGMWVSIATTYVKIAGSNIGAGFEVGDGVTVSGISGSGAVAEEAARLNGSHVIFAKDNNYIVVIGVITQSFAQEEGEVTVSRRIPEMDYMTECNNRIWGCKYGLVNGDTVNEIYACKLGDFKNWDVFQGLSTDSYRASRGSDGFWTGAITLGGYPLFFKENCLEKVYPSADGAHQIVTTNLRGVQKGSAKSMAIVDEVLYYKSATDICAYDGSLPVSISDKLGVKADARNAVGGSLGPKYYVSFDGSGGGLYVYDTRSGLWHREDDVKVSHFCRCDTEIYCITEDNQLLAMTGQKGVPEGSISWMAQTCTIGLSLPDRKYVTRLNLRLCASGTVRVYTDYDSMGTWEKKAEITGKGMLHSIVVPILPVRCDHMAIRLEGTGDFRLYSLTKTIEDGSDEG